MEFIREFEPKCLMIPLLPIAAIQSGAESPRQYLARYHQQLQSSYTGVEKDSALVPSDLAASAGGPRLMLRTPVQRSKSEVRTVKFGNRVKALTRPGLTTRKESYYDCSKVGIDPRYNS